MAYVSDQIHLQFSRYWRRQVCNVSEAVQIGLQCISQKMRKSINAIVFLETFSAHEIRNYMTATMRIGVSYWNVLYTRIRYISNSKQCPTKEAYF